MKTKNVPAIVILVLSLSVFLSMTIAAQDKSTAKALNGIAFSEFSLQTS